MVMRWGPQAVRGPDGHWHVPETPETKPKAESDPNRLANIALVCAILWGFLALSIVGFFFAIASLRQGRGRMGYRKWEAVLALILSIAGGLVFPVVVRYWLSG